MKIKLLRNTVCGGRVVLAGEVVDASDRDAQILITIRKAEAFVEPSPEAAAPEPSAEPEQAVIQAPETAVAKPQRARRAPKGGQ